MDPTTLLPLVPWLLPPLIGAVIGYLTNALAIRMLFRPLRPVRLFGLRVPLTPGVIPRRRGELAENIGRMVARELLTPEVFESRFGAPSFRESLQRFFVSLIDRVGDSSLAEAGAAVDVDRLVDVAATIVADIGADRIVDPVADFVVRYRDEFVHTVSRAVGDRPVLAAVDGTQLTNVVEHLWPSLMDHVESLIRSQSVQAEMHVRARRILSYALDQLSSLQRLFVTAAQYDRQLEARIPAIVERSTAEILQAMSAPSTREGVAAALDRWVAANRDRPLVDLLGPEGTTLVADALERFLSDRAKVGDVVERVVSANFGDRDRTAARIRRWLQEVLQHRGADRISVLVPVLRRRRATIGRWAAGLAQRALTTLTTAFLGQLDIRAVVVNRVDSLDVERVERLLLDIIHRHLRWINVFGAILGAAIGGVQLLLRFAGIV